MGRRSCAGSGRAAALSLVVLLATPVASAHGPRAASASPADVPASGRIVVVGTEFMFSPDAIRVNQGQEVTIVFRNEGRLSHNLTIRELGVHTDTIQSGAQDTVHFVARQTGTYPFWCTVPGHKEAGMTGTMKVTE